MGEKECSDEKLCANMRGLLLGGTDTSSIWLTFLFYYLGRYPQYHEALVKEIEEHMPKEITVTNAAAYHDRLSNLVMMTAVLREVNRLSPISPILFRSNLESDYQFEMKNVKYNVRKGTNMIVNVQDLSLKPELNDNSLEFYPERWLNKDSAANAMISSYPFGHGTRVCPGQHIGWIQMKVALCRILPELQVNLMHETQQLHTSFNLVSHPTGHELNLRLSAR